MATHLAFAIAVIGGKTVRTGGAYGIDQNAMEGSRGKNLEVYLPWASYNRDIIPPTARVVVFDPAVHTDWSASVGLYHPAANRLGRGAFSLHARNYGIVHGVKACIAFPDTSGGGGTGQGIRICKGLNIPVYQFNKGSIQDAPRTLGKLLQHLGFASKDLKPTISGRIGQ